MIHLIQRDRDGKLNVGFENTPGFPALRLAQKKCGADRVAVAAIETLDAKSLDDDVLVAFVQDSAAGRKLAKSLQLRLPQLPPSGYRIEVAKRQKTVLAVAGGDLFGMLAGLADLFLHSELTVRGLAYRGGARTEKPAFPLRYYWTWDHSTNWVLDDEGNQFSGCGNCYLKKPETYVEDYRRLVDHCVEMRFNGIVIWGFLRDAHGGEAYAHEVARYAADRGVAILPGLGTTGYGGVYYEGRHPFNIETYLARHPRRANWWKDGQLAPREISPYFPENQEWIKQGVEWLYRNFPIGGSNMENNDLMVDYSPAGKRARARIKSGEQDFFKDQFFAYKTALDVAHAINPKLWHTYATYSGFGPQSATGTHLSAGMGARPYFSRRMPASAIAQWTLTGMLSKDPIPLRHWMAQPRPPLAYRNPRWPRGIRPPTPRSAGFCHQGSQWSCPGRRTDVMVSTFAEACLRGYEAGLEGMSVHGEVTSRSLAWNLNYLAMRHWTYHPESTLEEFALAELAPRVGGEKAARTFVEIMCRLEEGKTGSETEKMLREFLQANAPMNQPARGNLRIYRMWEELSEWNILKDNRKSIAHGSTHLV